MWTWLKVIRSPLRAFPKKITFAPPGFRRQIESLSRVSTEGKGRYSILKGMTYSIPREDKQQKHPGTRMKEKNISVQILIQIIFLWQVEYSWKSSSLDPARGDARTHVHLQFHLVSRNREPAPPAARSTARQRRQKSQGSREQTAASVLAHNLLIWQRVWFKPNSAESDPPWVHWHEEPETAIVVARGGINC